MNLGMTMHLGSSRSTPRKPKDKPQELTADGRFSGNRFDVVMTGLSAGFAAAPVLSLLNVAGKPALDLVADPTSPELAGQPAPGRVSGNSVIVTGLVQPLEVGATYLVAYEIRDASQLNSLFFPATNGSPFPNTTIPRTVGVHHVLITAQDTDTTALLRLSGEAEFGFVSCRKAQWNVDLSTAMIPREMAASTNPGALSGSGVIVTALTEPLEVGAEYLVSYQVIASGGSLFTPANNGSPFGFRDLPASVGNHEVLLTALDSDTTAAMRINGALTFGSVSIRRAGSTAGQPVEWRVDYGTLSTQGTASTPDIAPTQELAQGQEIFVAAATSLDGTALRLSLSDVVSGTGVPAITALTVDGVDILGDVTNPTPPDIGLNFTAGAKGGGSKILDGTVDGMSPGDVYLLTYTITAGTGQPFSPGIGPFGSVSSSLFPNGIGTHSKLLTVKDDWTPTTGTVTNVIRNNGSTTYSAAALYRVDWDVTLAEDTELATSINLDLSGGGQNVASVDAAVEPDAPYVISYEVLDGSGTSHFYVTSTNSPFYGVDLPFTPGFHEVEVEAKTVPVAGVAIRSTGRLILGFVSIRRRGKIVATLDNGTDTKTLTMYRPMPGVWFAQAGASAEMQTGGYLSPFVSPELAPVSAGDTVYVRPGTYQPFELTEAHSGSVGNPVTFTTLPGEERAMLIKGDFDQHVVHGGPGVAQDNSKLDGIHVLGTSYVDILNMNVEWVFRNGIMIEGVDGVLMDTIRVAGCRTRNTGSSGISCIGFESGNDVLPVGEPIRIQDVVIELNDVAATNLPSDYRSGRQGVVEAVSVGKAVRNITTRWNYVHDTLQYGIDYKHGVDGGAIYENLLVNVEKHALYLDTNRRYINDVRIYNNTAIGCGIGLCFAREADFDGSLSFGSGTFENPEVGSPLALEIADMQQRLARIDAWNNLLVDCNTSGIYLARHVNGGDPAPVDGVRPWQSDSPHGTIEDVRIRFNTVYNSGVSGVGNEIRAVTWSDQAFLDAGIVSGFEIIGNIAYRPAFNLTGTQVFEDRFSGEVGFTVEQNHVGRSETNDPLFVDLDAAVTITFDYLSKPVVSGPDFTLQPGSPARGAVTGYSAGPFGATLGGTTRSDPADAGAY